MDRPSKLLSTCAAFQVEQMMNRMYAAIEKREAEEQELVQAEYEIAMRWRPGPVSLDQYIRFFGYIPLEVKGRVAGVCAAKAKEF